MRKLTDNIIDNRQLLKISSSITVGGFVQADLPSRDALTQPILDQAYAEAKEIILNAKTTSDEECRKQKETVHAELESIKKQAQDEGYELGLKQGFEAAHTQFTQEISSILSDAEQILKKIEQERLECLEDEEERFLRIISLIAKKIIARDLSYERDTLLNMIQQSIKLINNKAEINLIIHSHTAKQLNEIKAQIIDSLPGLKELTINANDDLAPGELILESNKERLDLRLESQIEELLKNLLDKNNEA